MSADTPENRTDAPQAPPPAGDGEPGKAGAGLRLLALLLAFALAFGGAVLIIVALNPDDTPRCEELVRAQLAGECFDVTKTQQTVQAVLAFPAGVLAGLAALVGLVVAFTGRRGQLMLRLVVPAVVLGALAVLVGQL